MDRSEGAAVEMPDPGRGIALYQRLEAWLEADAQAFPEEHAEGRYAVECSALTLVLAHSTAQRARSLSSCIEMAMFLAQAIVAAAADAWRKTRRH